MSLTCAISGESLTSTSEDVVVTPSGHTCLKRLLLAKLAETGGMDPFETIRERPLKEDDLITLNKKSIIPPPRPQSTSLPNILHQLQSEYDALVLELFDTRKALEETRQELSQALYQNDAAVRVVAKLSVERDVAQKQLEEWNASASISNNNNNNNTPAATTTTEQPASKKRKLEAPATPLENNLPEDDLQAFTSTWSTLQPQRKPMLKAAAKDAPSLQEDFVTSKKSWHKSTCKGVVCVSSSKLKVVTGGKDKQIVVYDIPSGKVTQTYSFVSTPTSVDIREDVVVAGNGKGRLSVYKEGNIIGSLSLKSKIVSAQIHPTGEHVCVATANGKVFIVSIEDKGIHHISTFSSEDKETYTCGALHPDGLIYAAGTSSGKILMWDFKNMTLASTLQDQEEGLVDICFSNNGYHLAAASATQVQVWDLRKQKTLATITSDDSVTCVQFDESGKYLAHGTDKGIQITTVKEWDNVKAMPTSKTSGIVWGGPAVIVTCNEKVRDILIYSPNV
jgi:pre-mRNA-processing factor 19